MVELVLCVNVKYSTVAAQSIKLRYKCCEAIACCLVCVMILTPKQAKVTINHLKIRKKLLCPYHEDPKKITNNPNSPKYKSKVYLHSSSQGRDLILYTNVEGARWGAPPFLSGFIKAKTHKYTVMGIRDMENFLIGSSLWNLPLCWYLSWAAGLHPPDWLPLGWGPFLVWSQSQMAVISVSSNRISLIWETET